MEQVDAVCKVLMLIVCDDTGLTVEQLDTVCKVLMMILSVVLQC